MGIERDFGRELQLLNRQIFRAVLFAGLIFLITGIFGQIQLIRMTRSLAEVTRVSNQVAAGDFSQKIKISRRDELGALIDSFNKMVDQLDESYGKLNRANVELANNIAELRRTRAELSRKERLALIGETISKISHEIQNKIGGVSIWVQNLEAIADENSRFYLNEMKQALNSFMKMLVNFKKFYREPQLNRTPVNMKDLMQKIIFGFSTEMEAKKVKVKTEWEDKAGPMMLDAEQMKEVIENILMNAIYFSPSGGTIRVICRHRNGISRIAISDEGPGVSPEQLENIFQPFFTTKSSGSGLGLAISYNIVRAHGGKIYYESPPEGGARFVIELPAQEHRTKSRKHKAQGKNQQ